MYLFLIVIVIVSVIEIFFKVMNLKVLVVVVENVDRLNIFLEIRNRLFNIKKFEKYDDLIYLIVLELKEKMYVFLVIIMYIENLEVMGYFF